jgi:hypothetical protein
VEHSPIDWLNRLLPKLEADRPRLQAYDNWYWGAHPPAHIPPELDHRYLTQFQQLLNQSKANFMQLVIDAMANRCRVQGFRLSAVEDETADQESWRMWQGSNMDAEHRLAIRDTFTKGRGALMVWSGDPMPTITVEDACQTIVEHEPGNRLKRAAALKVWIDEWTGDERANVYLPAGITKFKRVRPPDRTVTTPITSTVTVAVMPDAPKPPSEWEELPDEFVVNPVGIVPVIPLVARPDSMGRGHSELEGVIAIQERINGTIFNRVLAGWFAAFRQKWATGVTIPEDKDGNPVEPWNQAINRMFVDTDPTAKFGTFDATDLKQYLEAHESDVKDIAAITFTPRHFLIQQGQEPSGDAINSAEAGLIAKVKDREDYLSDAFEEAIRLARLFAGETDAPVESELVWADPRDPAIVEAARTDAIIKQYVANLISLTMAQEKLGYSPQQIERMANDIAAEGLRQRGLALTDKVLSGTDPDSQPAPV